MKIKIGALYVKRYLDLGGFNGVHTVTRISKVRNEFGTQNFIYSKLSDGRTGRYHEKFFRDYFRPCVDVNRIWKELNDICSD